MLRPMPYDPFLRTLVAAADQSIVACGAQQTVIAGDHWFSDGKPVEIQALWYNALRVMERPVHRSRLGVVDGAIHHRFLQGARSNPRESRAGEAMAHAVP